MSGDLYEPITIRFLVNVPSLVTSYPTIYGKLSSTQVWSGSLKRSCPIRLTSNIGTTDVNNAGGKRDYKMCSLEAFVELMMHLNSFSGDLRLVNSLCEREFSFAIDIDIKALG